MIIVSNKQLFFIKLAPILISKDNIEPVRQPIKLH